MVNMEQFVLFGDSITQGSFSDDHGFAFGAALSDSYVRKLDVINRGYSGYNTEQALQILPAIIPPPGHAPIRFMTIFFGANDARLPNTPIGPQQHVPLELYKRNLQTIVSHASVQAHKDIRLILITPPPIDERKTNEAELAMRPDLGTALCRTAASVARYAQAVREVGAETNVPVLDLWKAMLVKAGYNVPYNQENDTDPLPGSKSAPLNQTLQDMLYDGLHFSGSGYKVLCDELIDLIARTWPDQAPDELDYVLPRWDDENAWKDYHHRD